MASRMGSRRRGFVLRVHAVSWGSRAASLAALSRAIRLHYLWSHFGKCSTSMGESGGCFGVPGFLVIGLQMHPDLLEVFGALKGHLKLLRVEMAARRLANAMESIGGSCLPRSQSWEWATAGPNHFCDIPTPGHGYLSFVSRLMETTAALHAQSREHSFSRKNNVQELKTIPAATSSLITGYREQKPSCSGEGAFPKLRQQVKTSEMETETKVTRSTSKTRAPSPPLALLNPTDTWLCAARGGEGAAHRAPGAGAGLRAEGSCPNTG
ncbi:uncharacterized protein LOC122166752 [Centrocercus urophasianus]|uniref:uncharacterized protein LOC122166752 n=1 Tax=Centrocercus urophasianus TaxID=9002 RepID=UPI001C650549|nr:uncharacterized protein LOC122166752 [Centrocercus urophasianus]